MSQQPEVLGTIDDTCRALKVSRPTVYRLIESGELESLLIGTARRVVWRSVEAMIERKAAS